MASCFTSKCCKNFIMCIWHCFFSASVHNPVKADLWSSFELWATGWEPLIIHYSVPLSLENCVFVKLREQVTCTSMPLLRSMCVCAGVCGTMVTPWRYNSLIISTEHTSSLQPTTAACHVSQQSINAFNRCTTVSETVFIYEQQHKIITFVTWSRPLVLINWDVITFVLSR